MAPRPAAKKRTTATPVDRLRKAGILTRTQKLSKRNENKLNSLRPTEVEALIRVMRKVGRPQEVYPGIGRGFIIL